MSEMKPDASGIDNLLRSSLAAPIPSLPPDFDRKLMRDLREGSQLRDRYRRILLTAYGLLSIATSMLVVRGQGLDWRTTCASVLAPLVSMGAGAGVWRAIRKSRLRLAPSGGRPVR